MQAQQLPDMQAQRLPDMQAQELPDTQAQKLPDMRAQKPPDMQVIPEGCLCIQANSQVIAELASPLAAMLTILSSHGCRQFVINEGGLLLDGNVMPPFGPLILLVPILLRRMSGL